MIIEWRDDYGVLAWYWYDVQDAVWSGPFHDEESAKRNLEWVLFGNAESMRRRVEE